VIKLFISIIFFIIISSCQKNDFNIFTKKLVMKNESINNVFSEEISNDIKDIETNKNIIIHDLFVKYKIGEPYYIEGVQYIPKENYDYNEIGLASFYDKELHNKRTINNDLNKVTELLGRHKTLPLPSIVKITNLDNGLSVTIKINDRHTDNSILIQVSRKTSQLLRFYKNKIARVKVEILSDPSKQMKIVTQSMNDSNFETTILSAPTEKVKISNLDNIFSKNKSVDIIEQPIEIGFEEIQDQKLFLKIYGFTSYNNIKATISDLKLIYKFTTQKENNDYSAVIGPLENIEANNLVLSFISKGYKNTEFILK